MKKIFIFIFSVLILSIVASEGYCAIKWVSSSRCDNGGYYRDTSNDGNPYNNANYLGYND